MKITTFDKQNLQSLRKALNEALAKVSKEFDLEGIVVGNMRYTDKSVGVKLEIAAKGAKAEEKKQDESTANFYLKFYGLKVGDKFIDPRHGEFTIVGFNRRARKQPVELVDSKGKGYKTTVEGVKRFFVK